MVKINEQEKKQTAYRKKLEEDNKQLKDSLKSLQDQSSLIQQKNIDLEKDNSVLRERTKNRGWLSNANEAISILFGASIGYFVERNYFIAAILSIVALVVRFLSTFLSSIRKSDDIK